MKILNERSVYIELDMREFEQLKLACLKIDPKAETFTAIKQLINAFAEMSVEDASAMYLQSVIKIENPMGQLIQEQAKKHDISFGAARHLLLTSELPEKGQILND